MEQSLIVGAPRLFESSNQLSEALRNGFTPEAPALAEQVGRDYQVTVEAIRAFQEAIRRSLRSRPAASS